MRQARFVFVVALLAPAFGLTLVGGAAAQRRGALAQRRGAPPRRTPAVCGDPQARCRTTVEFEPHQLPFELSPTAVIFETEKFYMVVLKSARRVTGDCATPIPEDERVEAQKLFPRHKVFASRCYDPGELYYEGIAPETQFMAVFAGRTRAEADAVLRKVRATGRFPGAYLRRTSTGFNGT